MGGVWVFAQLILFAMLGSKTSPTIFPNLVTVLPIMAVGLLARFLGVLTSVKLTSEPRRTQGQRFGEMLADTFFCFLSCLPRATIQGALGAVPVNQRFFEDEAREDRSEARQFIFTAARLYIFCMSIVGMFLLNTFGPCLLEASSDRPAAEEAAVNDRDVSNFELLDQRYPADEIEADELLAAAAEKLGEEYDLTPAVVMQLLASAAEARTARSPSNADLSPIREQDSVDVRSLAAKTEEIMSETSPAAKTDPSRPSRHPGSREAGLRPRCETEPAPTQRWRQIKAARNTWRKVDNWALFDSKGPPVSGSKRPRFESRAGDEDDVHMSRARAQTTDLNLKIPEPLL